MSAASAARAPRAATRAPAQSPAVHDRRRRRHLRVVREEPRRHVMLFVGLYLAVGIAIVLGAVSLNALVAADAVAERELSAQVAIVERDYEQLVATVAGLEDPARIEAAAIKMGLVPAENPRFLVPGRGLPADQAPPPAAADGVKSLLTADGQ